MTAQVALPVAQQRLFDKLGREFDAREYTKALRSADSILGVAPEHADTIAMKGLTLFHLERKQEGYEHIRTAIKLHPRSVIAWHSLGMCQRLDKNYAEALKAFKCALATDATNANILRDISGTCVQLRDWEQFVDTREKMVTLKAGIRANWIALSCGHRMLGHTKLAAAVMDVMTAIMDAGDSAAEQSEVQLYRIELELESGAPQRALELLKQHDADIVDVQQKLLLRARAHTQLGQKAEAERRYMELLATGVAEADCIASIAQLRKISLDDRLRPKHDVERYMQLLEQVTQTCPRSEYARRHALDCMPLDGFTERLAVYAAGYVRRLVPSLFTVLKSLYQDAQRVHAIEQVFLRWQRELEANDYSSFDNERNPCFILWVYTYLASHYRRTGDYHAAHAYVDKAIAHTPTLELLYVEKAKIYAREGKTAEAAQQADFARTLDLQDKYLNSKAAKYFFRDNKVAEGEQVMQLFYAPPTVPGDTYLIALESQCAWYEREVGEAYHRMGDYISALQNLLMLELHHTHNHCELSDFHNYVFRRNTMRAWFDVIECDDDISKHPFFAKFAMALVRTYLKIDELGVDAVRAAHVPRPELPMDGLSAENAKRLAQLRRDYYIEDIDLSEPLTKAERYMRLLLARCGNDARTQLLAIDLYTALRKPVLVARALQALARMRYTGLPELITHFEQGIYAQLSASLDARVRLVVDEVLHSVKR